jgi:hypothetical protein
MTETDDRIAWVRVPSEDEMRSGAGARAPSSYDFDFVAGMARLRAAHPRIGPLLGAVSREILFGEGQLARPERELIAAVASAAQDCHY